MKKGTDYTSAELEVHISNLEAVAAKKPDKKPCDPYFFVGPPPPDPVLHERLHNSELFADFLTTRYGITRAEAPYYRSFRSEDATQKIISGMFHSVATALELPNTHRLTQVNGGGHQAAEEVIKQILVLDVSKSLETQRVFVDSALGGAFRTDLTLAEVKAITKRYIPEKEQRQHQIVTSGNGINVPTPDELEAAGVKFFFGTANETSTAQGYSDEDLARIREWKRRGAKGETRLCILDITSAIGAAPLSKNWDIIDAAFFPPQKAFKAPAETGFIVFSEEAIKWMESVKPKHLEVIDQKLFIKPSAEAALAGKKRQLNETYFYDPAHSWRSIQVLNSINLDKFIKTTIACERYTELGKEEKSIERGQLCLKKVTQWIKSHPGFDFFIENPENRSLSVGIIDITNTLFKNLSPELQDKTLARFHAMMGDQGVALPSGEVFHPEHVAYDIKTFPATPLPKNKIEAGQEKIRAIRFWLNVDPEKLQALLDWIEPVLAQALQSTLKEELTRVKQEERREAIEALKRDASSFKRHTDAVQRGGWQALTKRDGSTKEDTSYTSWRQQEDARQKQKTVKDDCNVSYVH